MLSSKATDFNIALCDKIDGFNFVILSWEEMLSFIEEQIEENELRELFEELRLNSCINLKYKDEDQACFALTDKARIITQEIRALAEEEPLVKTDENGRAVLVVPKTSKALANIKTSSNNSSSLKSLFTGFIGGILGGGLIYAIIYLIQNLS